MQMKQERTCRAHHHPLILALTAILAGGVASPALADSEIDALKKELAEQRVLIQKLLAQQQSVPAAAAPAAAAAGAGGPGVTWYGVLDTGIESISNVNTVANTNLAPAAKSFTRVPPIIGSSGSRLGVRGRKEFGAGYAGIATAEIGFNMSNGTLGQSGNQSANTAPSRIFGRQVFVGLETPAGTVTFGRQYSLLIDGLAISDLLGATIYSIASLDAYIPNARFDNSLVWKKSFGEFAGGLMYSTGRNDAANGGAPTAGSCVQAAVGGCNAYAGFAKYDNKTFGLTFGFDRQIGGVGAGLTNPTVTPPTSSINASAAPLFDNISTATGAPRTIAMTATGSYDQRVTAGGYYKLGQAKVALIYLKRDIHGDTQSADTKTFGITASYDFSPKISVDGGYYRTKANTSSPGLVVGDANLLTLRGFYKFDPTFATYLQLGHINNSSNTAYGLSVGAGVAPPKGGSQNGMMLGGRYMF